MPPPWDAIYLFLEEERDAGGKPCNAWPVLIRFPYTIAADRPGIDGLLF